MNNKSKILVLLGFLSSFIAYTFHPFLWDDAFYHLTSLSFMGYTSALYFSSVGTWSLVNFIVFCSCFNSFIDELFFNPQEININEYIGFLSIIIISVKYKKKWIR